MMHFQGRCVEENGELSHKLIPKPTVMYAIPRFFSKDFHRIELTCNMFHRDHFVLDPFANGVLPKLDMAQGFRGHVV
jgi:hypothetical protein